MNYALFSVFVKLKVAVFSYIKTLDEFDFTFLSSINEAQIRNITSSNFYQEAINIEFIGTQSVGKPI